MKELVLIIDFMNYVHRCRVGPLEGEFVLHFNFFRNLRATVEDFAPSKLFFALEGYPKHRYELFGDYKANRRIIKNGSQQTTKEQVLDAANDIQKLLLLLPITLAQHPDFEADDIIFSLCRNMKDESVVICSSDADCMQILQQGYQDCKLYNPIKKEFVDAPSEHFVALKSILGDKSDNIPKLLSPKKAQEAISNPEIFKSLMEKEEFRSCFNINRQLIEFHPIPEEEIIFQEGSRNYVALKEEFIRMDFQSIVNDNAWERYTKTFDCLKY